MINEIDLSSYDYAFELSEKKEEKVFSGIKQINYIYGKNGTGKSTLVKAIRNQYEDRYNVCVFQGFESLFENNQELNAIALGSENKESELIIKNLDLEIKKIDKNISQPDNPSKDCPNLYEQKQRTYATVSDKQRKIDRFKSRAASRIKNDHINIFGGNYDKNKFTNDISGAVTVSQAEIDEYFKTMNAETKVISDNACPQLPLFPNLCKIRDAVNSILNTVVKPSTIIEELDNNADKKAFALQGMNVHSRVDGERCSFCGNIISENRWKLLDAFFSDEVDKLQKRISNGKRQIETQLKKVNLESKFDKNVWQSKFLDDALKIWDQVNEKQKEIKIYLTALEQALSLKEQNLFDKLSPIKDKVPESFSELQKELDLLWSNNVNFNNNLGEEKKVARKKLRQNFVALELNSFDYRIKTNELKNEKLLLKEKDNLLEMENKKKQDLIRQRSEEIGKTKNEAKAANEINKLIMSLGDDSFRLEHVAADGKQLGLYKVLDRNSCERSIETLSTGEKNILSFLWFLYHLKDTDDPDRRPKVIIFDDPVNSNDDASQYLIMSEIQKLISDPADSQIFLLTHNTQFYVQVRPSNLNYKQNKRAYFHLIRSGKTKIKAILSKKEELTTIYEDLWEELEYAYSNNRIMTMWNCMRRIIEAYGRFNFNNTSPKDSIQRIDSDVDAVLFSALMNGLNVNSHVGYETDLDIENINRDTLLSTFKEFFHCMGADNHYAIYWAQE